jgi:hypothetical protein
MMDPWAQYYRLFDIALYKDTTVAEMTSEVAKKVF